VSDNFKPAIDSAQIAPGGMKAVEIDGREYVVCNCDGSFYAIDRRCGHMNAPLDFGTLDGVYLTCAMHCAQFDVTTGEALSGPVPHDYGTEPPPPKIGLVLRSVGLLMQKIRTCSIGTYQTKVLDGKVCIGPALEANSPPYSI